MKQRRLPNIFNNLIENGYPFFKGELEIDGNVFIQEISKKVLLELDGRFLVANIIINDKQIDMVMDNKVEITDFIKKGDNKIKIILKSSLRNLFGPHHFKPNPEPLGVSPYNFTYRTNWLNNDPIHYTSKYNSVYFGVKKIVLKSLK